MSYDIRESVSGGWNKEGAAKGRRERVEGRQTLQYSWLALYVSHKLAGELPLSDSLTEHTLFPARIVSSLHLFSSHSRTLILNLSLVFLPFLLPSLLVFRK